MMCISYNIRSTGPPTVGRFFFENKEAGSNYQGASFESFKKPERFFLFFKNKKKLHNEGRIETRNFYFLFFWCGETGRWLDSR